ncbi:MAG: VOC family protein [Gaiellaceae bacterium]
MVMFGGGESVNGGGVYVVVEDVDAHCAVARDAGAEITRGPEDTDYGSREYGVRDPEGLAWHFGTYQPFEVSPTGP